MSAESGSAHAFPWREEESLLGLEFPDFISDAPRKIRLMGRVWPAITEEVNLMLRPFSDNVWQADVDFVVEDELPFGLLGCEGFLNNWAVSFNSYLGYFIVEPVDDFHARQPAEILEALAGLAGLD